MLPLIRRIPWVFLMVGLLWGGPLVAAASAELKVELDVRKVAEHSVLVTLMWSATIVADREWEGCELLISFRDIRDREIHRITRTLSLESGRNEIAGHEICGVSVWEKTRKFSGKLNCGF